MIQRQLKILMVTILISQQVMALPWGRRSLVPKNDVLLDESALLQARKARSQMETSPSNISELLKNIERQERDSGTKITPHQFLSYFSSKTAQEALFLEEIQSSTKNFRDRDLLTSIATLFVLEAKAQELQLSSKQRKILTRRILQFSADWTVLQLKRQTPLSEIPGLFVSSINQALPAEVMDTMLRNISEKKTKLLVLLQKIEKITRADLSRLDTQLDKAKIREIRNTTYNAQRKGQLIERASRAGLIATVLGAGITGALVSGDPVIFIPFSLSASVAGAIPYISIRDRSKFLQNYSYDEVLNKKEVIDAQKQQMTQSISSHELNLTVTQMLQTLLQSETDFSERPQE